MGEYVVKLPDVGEGVAEAEIVAWHVNVGDTVDEDAAFVEVMTDKATVELPSPVGGRVTRLAGEVGDVVAVGSPLIWLDVDGAQQGEETAPDAPPEDQPAPTTAELSEDQPAPTTTAPPPTSPAAGSPAVPTPPPKTTPKASAPLAAPAVRRRAQLLGIDLADVTGTGEEGRVQHSDLDDHLTSRSPVASAPRTTELGPDEVNAVKIVGLRRNIAKRMQEAHRIPHFTYVEEVDVGEVERLRAELNERRAPRQHKLTVLPFLMRAVVIAAGDFPAMNARFDDASGVVSRHGSVHLGIATQTPKGLMVPVVKHAEAGDLWSFAAEVTRLSEAARAGTVTLEELSGSTITITSLGSLGGVVSTPVINAPEVAIIGVNKIVQRPVFVDGGWTPRQIMNLSSSFDHRVIDGWDAALFIQRIKGLLETPALLFIEG